MGTDPTKVQGSDADRAEGGLDVEAEFAELDEATATRMSREAKARRTEGHSAVDMLTSPAAGRTQDDRMATGETAQRPGT